MKNFLFAILLITSCSTFMFEEDNLQEEIRQTEILTEPQTRSSDTVIMQYDFPSVNDGVIFSSYAERVRFYQIPEDQLTTMSTEELASACLDYPLLLDAFAFNTLSQGVRTVLSRFNGYNELLDRRGAWDSVSSQVKARKTISSTVRPSVYDLSEKNLKVQIWDEILRLEELVMSSSDPLAAEISRKSRQYTTLSLTPYHLYTPNRSLVKNTYKLSEELTPATKIQIKNYWMNALSGLVYVSEATTTYNCHFYAWSEKYPDDTAWLGYYSNDLTAEDIYWEDGSYIETTENDPDAQVVSFANGNHSALKFHGDTLISKWGQSCVFLHTKYNCPYDASILKYYKKVQDRPHVDGPTFPISMAINGHHCDFSYKLVNRPPVTASVQWAVTGNGQIISGQGTDSVRVRIYDSLAVVANVTTTYGKQVSFSTGKIRVQFLQPYIFSYQAINTGIGAYNNRQMVLVKINNAPRTVSWSLKKNGMTPPVSHAFLDDAFLGEDASYNQPQFETKDFVVTKPGEYEITLTCIGPFGNSTISIPVSVSGTDMGGYYIDLQYNWGTPIIQHPICFPIPPTPPDIPLPSVNS